MNKPVGSFQGRPIVAEHGDLTITRVGAHLGAEITGIDLRQGVSDEQRATQLRMRSPKTSC